MFFRLELFNSKQETIMNTTKPTFTDEERNRLHSVNNSFEEIKHRKKVFIQTIFSESDRRTVDHHPGATLKLDEDGNSIFFDGYGYTLQAQDRKSTRLNSSHVAISY